MNISKLISYLLFLGFIFQLSAQETVFLESTQKGRGILKSRSGECFVITPEHVVSEAVSTINIKGAKNVLSNGSLVQSMEGVDLAIVRVVDGGTQNCTNWSVPKNYTSILNNSINAYLELRDESGGAKIMHVLINGKDEDMIEIVPKLANESFMKGMSGGSLFTQYEGKKVYLGMLQVIGEEGEGYVFQADDMERILGGFFGESTKKSSVSSMTMAEATPSAMSVEEEGYRFDLIDVKKSGTTVVCKLKVTSLENDSKLKFVADYGGSVTKMYDQNGIEINASTVKLGSLEGKGWVGHNYTLVKDIPVSLIISFKEVPEKSTGMALLKIQSQDFEIKFKNISFESLTSNIEVPIYENVLQSNEIEGYKFDLIDVKKSGTVVVCKLNVTSLGKDGKVKVVADYGGSITKMYDQNGIGINASTIKLGSLIGKGWVGHNYTLVKGVPVSLIITFKDVSEESTGISLLKIQAQGFEVKFKNISFDPRNSNFNTPVYENVLQSNELEGFKFDLMGVKKSGTTLTFNLRLTSLDKDSSLGIVADYGGSISKMYDQNGIEINAYSVKLGSLSGKGWVGQRNTLVKGISTQLRIIFKEVPAEAMGASLLKIQAKGFDVQFRNISFN